MESESLEVAESSPKGRYLRVLFPQYSKLLRSSGPQQVYLGLDKDTGRKVHWHLIQFAGVSVVEKERFVSQAEKLKTAKQQYIAGILAVWGVRGRDMVVMICSHESGETLSGVNGRAFSEKMRVWGPQILSAMEYLQDCKASPIRISRQSILVTEERALLEDVIMLPGKAEPEEELLRPETDVLSFAAVLLEALIPGIAPMSLSDLLAQIRESRAFRLLEKVPDERLRDLLSHCLCPAPQRWSIPQLAELCKTLYADSSLDFRSPLLSQHSASHDSLPADTGRQVIPISLIIETEDSKINVAFTFHEGEDSPDRVAEELLQELRVSGRYIRETAAAITRKLSEKVLSRSAGLREDVEEPPRMERSTSVLLETARSIKPVRSGGDLKTEPDRSMSRKNTAKVPAPLVFLKKGQESNDSALVKQVQERLNLVLKEEIKADGQFGKKTENLVKQFQEQEGLPVTGVVDPTTWATLLTQFNRLWKNEELD